MIFRPTAKISQNLAILGLTGKGYLLKDIKKAYYKAMLKWHPDINPAGLEMTKVINAAWEFLLELGDQETFDTTDDQQTDYTGLLSDALEAIIDLMGLEIEVCGTWVWVGGDTKAHKAILKENKFKWHSKKELWYMAPAGYVKKRRGRIVDHDKVRATYGSERVNRKSYKIAIGQ